MRLCGCFIWKKYVVPLNVLAVFMCVSDCLCHFWLDSRYRYIDKSCFEMKILNNLARNCVCLSYLFKNFVIILQGILFRVRL